MPGSGLGTAGIVAIPIPAGGALGQVLTKLSGDNYDFDWQDTAGGFVGLGVWRYRTEIVAPPASGQVRFNNATIESATIMWINETNDGGTDVSVFLDLLSAGSIIFLQDQSDADNFVIVEIDTITDEGTYREITIAEVEAQGSAFTQNLRIAVVISGGGSAGSPQRNFFESMGIRAFVFSDFFEPPGGLQVDGLQAISAGAGASVSTPTATYDFTDHPGVWGLNTGTTSAGRVFLLSQFAQGFHVGVGGITRHGCWYQSPAVASIAANRYVIRSGFFSMALPNTILQGIGFEAQDNQNGNRWQAICEDGIGETSVDTGVAVGTSTYFKLEFEVNAAGTSVEFFIDDVSVATIVTNIPSGTGFGHFISEHIMKLIGLANRASYVDAYYLYQEITR
jgi:hypothetical protein